MLRRLLVQTALAKANEEINELEALLNVDKDREAPLIEQVKRLREHMKQHRNALKDVNVGYAGFACTSFRVDAMSL